MNLERISLEQLRVFAEVVRAGSFLGAAKAIGRTQSAVSYTVATLEQQLGIQLFDRSQYRPKLTPTGEALLGDAHAILERVDRMQARASAIEHGLEAELALAVDVYFPLSRLLDCLNDFRATFPSVTFRLYVEALGAVAERVLAGSAQLGILATLPELPSGLDGFSMPPIRVLAVASPDHPLVKYAGALDRATLQEHVQLVLTDRSALTEGRDYGVISPTTWRLSDLGVKHAMLLASMGWGYMPIHWVEDDLAAGRLVALPLDMQPKGGMQLAMHVATRIGQPVGPALRWWIERLRRAEVPLA
ncbi:LysR family transcriptional regulator [Silvimonas amylolytica]|uniref:LysR family transcriptional regulator n=1 Tax=Silvimonas amylolytica TaxID=449663 RepID=A0ABQ2PNR8_9NEIS|nr:LysR family transcriptional regulator [Silvimonas amylolytica]GGP26662.1 LysR family transcriptional regulator [Silvimonas amylolytica]